MRATLSTMLALPKRAPISLLLFAALVLLGFTLITGMPRAGLTGFTQTFAYIEQADGSWEYNRYAGGYRSVIEFWGGVRFDEGVGWRRWDVTPAIITRMGAAAATQVFNQAQLREIEREGWQRLMQATRSQSKYHNITYPALAMLRDGEHVRIDGAIVYYARRVTGWTGAAMLALIIVRGIARARKTSRARAKLMAIGRGVCPECRYPFPPGQSRRGVCTECGTDIDRAHEAAIST